MNLKDLKKAIAELRSKLQHLDHQVSLLQRSLPRAGRKARRAQHEDLPAQPDDCPCSFLRGSAVATHALQSETALGTAMIGAAHH